LVNTAYVKLLRPVQWLKNLMILFPPFLGGALLEPGLLVKSFVPVLSFCLASSSSYILNDILDADNDARHPTKKQRPVASGTVNKCVASVLSFFLMFASLMLGYQVSTVFLLLLVAYLSISLLYSLKLKEFPILDIFCISAGFLFRLFAGGEAFSIVISEWLFLSVFLLAMFLSTGKRFSERILMGSGAGLHRKSLNSYPEGVLEGILFMTGAAVLVTYTMYVISSHKLVYTVPLCLFGLLRYIYLVKTGKSGDPTESLCRDKMLFVVGFSWVIMVAWDIYGRY
jgi:decaprenyl-phosphate phosphoribosyltransferase